MIYTTYFAQLRNLPEHIVPISIARSTPKWFTGLEYKKLAPTWEILSEWKNSEVKGKREEEQYINAFKSDVLSKLNPLDVVRELNVGSEHRFGTGFGIFIDLLELVNSNENFVLNLVEIGENAPNGHFRLRRIHI